MKTQKKPKEMKRHRTKDPPAIKPLRLRRKGFRTETLSGIPVAVPIRNTSKKSLKPRVSKVKRLYPQVIGDKDVLLAKYSGASSATIDTNAEQLSLFPAIETGIESKQKQAEVSAVREIPAVAVSICIGSMTIRHYLALWEFWTDEPTGWEQMSV